MGQLEGQVALVTGGGSGIGRAVVAAYAAEGAQVVVLEQDAAAAAALHDDVPGVRTVVGDVRDNAAHRRAVATAVDDFGRLDVLVANAGLWDYATPLAGFADADELETAYRELFDVNVLGVLHAVAAARAALVASRGAVVVTGSPSGRHAGGGGPLYVASKHAVTGLVRQLAYELAPDVRVNAVAPGATRTALAGPTALGQAGRNLADETGLHAAIARALPLGFVAEAEDHAALYVLLGSRAASRCMTAAVVPSDGGIDVLGGGRRRARDREVAR